MSFNIYIQVHMTLKLWVGDQAATEPNELLAVIEWPLGIIILIQNTCLPEIFWTIPWLNLSQPSGQSSHTLWLVTASNHRRYTSPWTENATYGLVCIFYFFSFKNIFIKIPSPQWHLKVSRRTNLTSPSPTLSLSCTHTLLRFFNFMS